MHDDLDYVENGVKDRVKIKNKYSEYNEIQFLLIKQRWTLKNTILSTMDIMVIAISEKKCVCYVHLIKIP